MIENSIKIYLDSISPDLRRHNIVTINTPLYNSSKSSLKKLNFRSGPLVSEGPLYAVSKLQIPIGDATVRWHQFSNKIEVKLLRYNN